MGSVQEKLKNYLKASPKTGLLLIGNDKSKEDARYVAASLLKCQAEKLGKNPDFLSINLPDNAKTIGVEQAEEILIRTRLMPSVSERIVVLIEDMDKMTVPAQNKLLKLIEDSENAVVIATATEDVILSTIKSRMRVIYYEPLTLYEFISSSSDDEDTALKMFFISGGVPGGENMDLMPIYDKVEKAIKEGHFEKLLDAFSMVSEKSGKDFFTVNRKYVGAMISYIGTLITNIYPTDFSRIDVCNNHKQKCNALSYTKDNFFAFLVALIEGGR